MGIVDLFEAIKYEVNMDISLDYQDVIVDDFSYVFEEVYEDDWYDYGKFQESFTIYRVSKYTTKNEFIEDLDMFIRQDCIRSGSYYSDYEFEYEDIYLVEEKEEVITRKVWERIENEI